MAIERRKNYISQAVRRVPSRKARGGRGSAADGSKIFNELFSDVEKKKNAPFFPSVSNDVFM